MTCVCQSSCSCNTCDSVRYLTTIVDVSRSVYAVSLPPVLTIDDIGIGRDYFCSRGKVLLCQMLWCRQSRWWWQWWCWKWWCVSESTDCTKTFTAASTTLPASTSELVTWVRHYDTLTSPSSVRWRWKTNSLRENLSFSRAKSVLLQLARAFYYLFRILC